MEIGVKLTGKLGVCRPAAGEPPRDGSRLSRRQRRVYLMAHVGAGDGPRMRVDKRHEGGRILAGGNEGGEGRDMGWGKRRERLRAE